MSKYNKSQINFILDKLRHAAPYQYDLAKRIFENTKPKPTAKVLKAMDVIKAYEEEVKKIRKVADEKAEIICGTTRAYIDKVENKLVLGDCDFDIDKALADIKKLVG